MLLGIDHLVIACPDVDAAARDLERAFGLRTTGGGRHDRLGTENRLVWLGDSYLELIGVFDEALAASSWIGEPTLRTLRSGGGLATYAVATDHLEAELERLRGQGARLEGPFDGERRRPDGRVVRWRLGLPLRLGPDEPPFLIEHDASAAEWTPEDRAARASEGHPLGGPVRLTALELPVPDMAAARMRYVRTFGLLFRPSLTGRGARDASVGAHVLRLRPGGAGDRPVVRLEALMSSEPLAADVLGLRFVLSAAPGPAGGLATS